MLLSHGVTPSENILARAWQLNDLMHNLWEEEKEDTAKRRAARMLEEKRRWDALLADATIPTRVHRFLHALFSLPAERFESPRKLREGLEKGRTQPYHELDHEGPPRRYIWSSLRAYELRGRNADTDDKLFYYCWAVRQADDKECHEAATWISSFQLRMSITVDEIVHHPFMDIFLEAFLEVAEIYRYAPLSFATIYDLLNKRSESCKHDFRQRVIAVFGTSPFKEGRVRRSAPTTAFQVAFSHCTQAYLLCADEGLGETWSTDQFTDCYESLTKLQHLNEKHQEKVARNVDGSRMADVGKAGSESDSSRSSRGGCVSRDFAGPAIINTADCGSDSEAGATDDAVIGAEKADSDSASQGTSGSEVHQNDPEEFNFRPRLPELPDDLKRVPAKKLAEMFSAMRNHDESARTNLCRVIKLMPPSMARALGIGVPRVQGMDPRFVSVLRDKLFCKLIDIQLYNNFCRKRRGGGGGRALARARTIRDFVPYTSNGL